ncbi:hypothetical protein H4582DRAFT_2052143 [Lactarius indigo]|nr:hypothetical protein H4582DRAFT_2052143 [Lactarius indigo]
MNALMGKVWGGPGMFFDTLLKRGVSLPHDVCRLSNVFQAPLQRRLPLEGNQRPMVALIMSSSASHHYSSKKRQLRATEYRILLFWYRQTLGTLRRRRRIAQRNTPAAVAQPTYHVYSITRTTPVALFSMTSSVRVPIPPTINCTHKQAAWGSNSAGAFSEIQNETQRNT